MKLVGMVQTYNEMESGNLPRCIASLVKYCDEIIVYNDGSTDSTEDFLFEWQRVCFKQMMQCQTKEIHVINAKQNDFKNELAHKQQMIELAKDIGADWILRMDADEVIEPRGVSEVRTLISDNEKTGWAFHMINLWRSPAFYRVDNGYNDVIFNRLWRVHPDLHFNVQTGLHLTNYPVGATDKEGFTDLQIIHYGFASDEAIIAKYKMYKSHGQSGAALARLVDERTLAVRRSKAQWFEDIDVHSIDASHVFREPLIQKVQR
jgi:glycosyltransferase involved in cell wall biosynthesis